MFIQPEDKIRKLKDEQFAYVLPKGVRLPNIDAKTVRRLRQLADFSFPLIKDMTYLEEMADCKNLNEEQVIIATQAAIESLLFENEHDFSGYPAAENIKKYYEHLIINSEHGYEDKDLEDIKKETTVKLNLETIAQYSADDAYYYGPCFIETSYAISHAFKYNILAEEANGTKLVIIDEDGKIITEEAVGREFYIKLPKKEESEFITISLFGETSYAADISISEDYLFIDILNKQVNDRQIIELNYMQIQKYSNSAQRPKLSGAVFDLYLDEQFFDEAQTNEEGEGIFYNLLPGDYTLREIKPPKDHYIEGDGLHQVKICAYRTSVEIENEAVTGSLSIFCFEETRPKKGIEDAVFKLYDDSENFICHMRTGKDGRAEVAELQPGIYTVKNGGGRRDYFLNHNISKINLTGDHEDGVINKKLAVSGRKKKYGRVFVSVHDYIAAEIKLVGAEFELLDAKGCVIETLRTDKDGIALSPPLVFAAYGLRQKKCAEGYAPLEETIIFSVDGKKQKSIAISNKKNLPIKTGLFRIENKPHKESDVKLYGAMFEVIDSSGETVDRIITKANDCAESKALPFGIYKVYMRRAAEGYRKAEEVFMIEIDTETFIKTICVISDANEVREKGRVRIFCAANVIKGAKYQIYDAEDNLKALLVTDASGAVLSPALPFGEYKIFDALSEKFIMVYLNSTDTVQTVLV